MNNKMKLISIVIISLIQVILFLYLFLFFIFLVGERTWPIPDIVIVVLISNLVMFFIKRILKTKLEKKE